MTVKAPENPLYCGSQNGKAKSAKSRFVARIARPVRQAGLSCDEWRYVARRVRQKCELHPAARPKKLPRILTADQVSLLARFHYLTRAKTEQDTRLYAVQPGDTEVAIAQPLQLVEQQGLYPQQRRNNHAHPRQFIGYGNTTLASQDRTRRGIVSETP